VRPGAGFLQVLVNLFDIRAIDLNLGYGKIPYHFTRSYDQQRAAELEDSKMATPARFDLKLDKDEKELFAEAASLMGTSMAGFVRAAAKEKARALIEQESRLTLSRRDFVGLSKALDGAFAPNQPLQEALDTARQTVRRA